MPDIPRQSSLSHDFWLEKYQKKKKTKGYDIIFFTLCLIDDRIEIKWYGEYYIKSWKHTHTKRSNPKYIKENSMRKDWKDSEGKVRSNKEIYV